MDKRFIRGDAIQDAVKLCGQIHFDETGELQSEFIVQYEFRRIERNGFILGIYDENTLTGMITGKYTDDLTMCGLGNLSVLTEYRRKGIARTLLSDAMEIAIQVGCFMSYLAVEKDNRGAIALYEELGFRPTGVASEDCYEMASLHNSQGLELRR